MRSPPLTTIPPDPAAPAALPFRLACLLARGGLAGAVLAAVPDWGDPRAQAALVDGLAAAKAWVGGGVGGEGGLLGPPGFEARLLRRVAAAAEAARPAGPAARDGDEDDEDDGDGVQEGLAAALAAALLAGAGPAPPTTAAPAWADAALVFGRRGGPATLIRVRLCSDFLAGDTGCTVWPAALALGLALVNGRAPEAVHGRAVLELGAGTGVLGALLARAPATAPSSLTLTDGDAAALANAAQTVAANGFTPVVVGGEEAGVSPPPPPPLPSVRLARLAWSAHPPAGLVPSLPPPGGLLVLGADVSYDPAGVGPLAACVAALLRAGGPGAAALIAGVRRTATSAAAFEAAAEGAGLGVERWRVVGGEEGGGGGGGGDEEVRCWGGVAGAGAAGEEVVGWRLTVGRGG